MNIPLCNPRTGTATMKLVREVWTEIKMFYILPMHLQNEYHEAIDKAGS